jgi:hypothetical protein
MLSAEKEHLEKELAKRKKRRVSQSHLHIQISIPIFALPLRNKVFSN